MIIMTSTLAAAINSCRNITTGELVRDNLVNMDKAQPAAGYSLYDTEHEITGYKALPALPGLMTEQIEFLVCNLYTAAEKAWIDHNELLAGLILEDIETTERYLEKRKATE